MFMDYSYELTMACYYKALTLCNWAFDIANVDIGSRRRNQVEGHGYNIFPGRFDKKREE